MTQRDFKYDVDRDDLIVTFTVSNVLGMTSPRSRAAAISAVLADAANDIASTVDGVRARRDGLRTTTTSKLPSVQQTPNCPGCGTAVAKVGDVCAVCIQKPQYAAPEATIAIGKQPDPAYDGAPAQAVSRG